MGNIRSILSCVVERGASAGWCEERFGHTELCKVSFLSFTFFNLIFAGLKDVRHPDFYTSAALHSRSTVLN